ncbi:MAG: TetR/AcrR family transcriptional regulator [Planctomycetes bacterium]|nr:TetR/AcrR family transcriptional regulator [Planctomycetota bacterium]
MPTTTLPSATRESILDSARALLARLGYRKTAMEDVARDAGLSRRTIYLHFTDKADLFLATIGKLVDGLLGRLEQELRGSGTPTQRLLAMLELRVLYRFDGVADHYKSLDELMANLRPAYLERREHWFEAEARIFARAIEEGMRTGEFARGDASVLARTLVTATNALLPYSLSPRELGSRKDVERTVADLAALLVRGLRNTETRT